MTNQNYFDLFRYLFSRITSLVLSNCLFLLLDFIKREFHETINRILLCHDIADDSFFLLSHRFFHASDFLTKCISHSYIFILWIWTVSIVISRRFSCIYVCIFIFWSNWSMTTNERIILTCFYDSFENYMELLV